MLIPKPRKLKSGNYFIQLRIGGESVPITERTEKECVKQAQVIKAEYLAGKRKKPVEFTLGQAIDNYLSSRNKVVSPATVRTYKDYRKTRFQKVIYKKLNEIDWQSAVNDEAARVSATTVKRAWSFVRSVLKYHNLPTPGLTLPQIVEKDKPWLDPEQIPAFLKAIEGDNCEAHILLALHGLRCSEMLAVNSWDKISGGVIKVQGAIVKGENGYVEKDTNKNTSSRRNVPIMIPRLKELLNHKESTPFENLYPSTVYKHINKHCEKLGFPKVGVHGLRRSFASLCYHLKLSELEVMSLGGWNDISTMRKIYIKLSQKDKDKAQEKLIEFFAK
ncbi:MAG: site-specific integrase [Oscillospiraceae bacterium]|nr:site-specific integrase [Oscillospiraceae bacterium]